MLPLNKGDFVEDCVNSILAQTYQNWELLFVADSSNDDTISKILNLRDDDERIQVFCTILVNGLAMHMSVVFRQTLDKSIRI